MLDIISGNAGCVVEAILYVARGSRGAALPVTMAALLCNLLVNDSQIKQTRTLSLTTANLRTELLVSTAKAVVSSFAVPEQPQVGVSTSSQLLLFHALSNTRACDLCDKESTGIIHEPRIAEILSRRTPDMDAKARE